MLEANRWELAKGCSHPILECEYRSISEKCFKKQNTFSISSILIKSYIVNQMPMLLIIKCHGIPSVD